MFKLGLIDVLARRLRTLNPLRTFVVAAREGGFSAAADKLALTHAAVSKQIAGLELDLGTKLFERGPRAVSLTPEGRELHMRLEAIFKDLENALARFDTGMPPRITISCEPTLCSKLLIPILPVADEDILIQVLSAGGPVDFLHSNVDVAIRRDDFPIGSNVFVSPIAPELTGPVVSPRLLVGGEFRSDSRLAAIHARTRPDAWSNWLARSGRQKPANRDVTFDNHMLAAQAALAGQGIAMLSPYMIAEELAEGRLVAPYGFSADGSRYVAMSSRPLGECPTAARLVEIVRGRFTVIAAEFG